MNPWHRGTLAAFDIESTGTSVDHDRIVTATFCRIHGADVDTRSWLVNPGIPIPAGAADVHGITDERAQAEGMAPREAVTQIAGNMRSALEEGVPVVAFNAAYDFTLLERECRRYGVAFNLPYVVDPFVIDKELDKWRKGKRTLTATCEHYKVRLDGAHDATQDALAAARVAWRLAEKYPHELQAPLEVLHGNQQAWRADWAVSFQTYLRTKKGETDAVVSGAWPVQPLPAGWDPTALPVIEEAA